MPVPAFHLHRLKMLLEQGRRVSQNGRPMIIRNLDDVKLMQAALLELMRLRGIPLDAPDDASTDADAELPATPSPAPAPDDTRPAPSVPKAPAQRGRPPGRRYDRG